MNKKTQHNVRKPKTSSVSAKRKPKAKSISSTISHIATKVNNNNIIYFTATDDKVVNFDKFAGFGANVVSCSYENGQGIIVFDVPVTTIGSKAFSGCYNLKSIIIPDNVTSIGSFAFSSCSSLISVTIPDRVTSIGEEAFRFCTSLTSVTIPDSVTSIGIGAFRQCSSLTAFYGKFTSLDNRCLIVDGVLNSFAPANLTVYTIPYGITSIGDFALQNCTTLTSITIPNSVTSIGIGAFSLCLHLTTITIQNSVIWIRDYAFFSCIRLKSVYVKSIFPPMIAIGVFDTYNCNTYPVVEEPLTCKIYVPRNYVDNYNKLWNRYKSNIVGYDF